MATKTQTIRIESILGGHSPMSHFGRSDQFRASLGIDPALPIDDTGAARTFQASGLIRPSSATEISGTDFTNPGLWMINNPKDSNLYVYDAAGSLWAGTTLTVSDISDGGSLSNSSGNGAAYYDNYIYLSKDTTVARYGPLNGTPVFDGNYWTTTLGLTALSDTTYPEVGNSPRFRLPNHVLHRHSDGKLYIADVVDNQGTIHYIKTTKTTVEGDTNDNSTYDALEFGYGLYPTAMESYGSDLVVALFEGGSSGTLKGNAKIAFWDTTSANFNKIIWVEFPDTIITAMKNINGVLYIASGNNTGNGFRITRFVGGYTVEEVLYSEYGFPPLAGAMDGDSKRLLMGSSTIIPESAGCVYSLGLQKAALSQGLFNVLRAPLSTSAVTALALYQANGIEFRYQQPFFCWSDDDGGGAASVGVSAPALAHNQAAASVFWSQMYRVGRPFRIQRIRIPFGHAIAANMSMATTIYTDDGSSTYAGDTYGIPTVNTSSFPNGERYANFKVKDVMGYQNFFLQFRWAGTALLTVNLPIEIDIEIIDDQ